MNSTCDIIYDGDFSGRLVRVDQVAVPVECRQPEEFLLRNQEVVKFVITVEMEWKSVISLWSTWL